jgi:hypothetical protein
MVSPENNTNWEAEPTPIREGRELNFPNRYESKKARKNRQNRQDFA